MNLTQRIKDLICMTANYFKIAGNASLIYVTVPEPRSPTQNGITVSCILQQHNDSPALSSSRKGIRRASSYPPVMAPATNMYTCPFCKIAAHTPSSPPYNDGSSAHDDHPPRPSLLNNPQLVSPASFVILSTPQCLAFLDIMPLAQGHVLVTTRQHRGMVSDVDEDESRELGFWLPVLSRVIANVTATDAWNIVQNNGTYNVKIDRYPFLPGKHIRYLSPLKRKRRVAVSRPRNE